MHKSPSPRLSNPTTKCKKSNTSTRKITQIIITKKTHKTRKTQNNHLSTPQIPTKLNSTHLTPKITPHSQHFSTSTSSPPPIAPPPTLTNTTHIDPSTNPLHQYSPNRFFSHPNASSYTHQTTLYFDNAYGLTELAKSLGRLAQNPQLQSNILLYGDLGTGKTTFSRYFLRQIMNSPALAVVSPTFTLQVSYHHNKRSINHMDLYRLKQSQEAHILNILDTFDEQILDFFPQNDQNNPSLTPTPTQTQGNNVTNTSTLSQLQTPLFTLPNTKKKNQTINLIEWPHVLHDSIYMPKSYIRIDIKDRNTHKEVTLSLCGRKYLSENFEQFCGEKSKSWDEKKLKKSNNFGDFIVQNILIDLNGLFKEKEYVDKLTEVIYFGDNEGSDIDSQDEYNEEPIFVPKQFTNHRL